MKEPKLTHTQKRNGVYYFRRKIPLDLIAHYGKAEINFSLKTKERKEAEPQARKWGVFYDDEFADVRKSLSFTSAPTSVTQLENKPLEPININQAILKRIETLRAARAREITQGKGQLWIQTIRAQLEMSREYLQNGEHPLFENNPSVTEAEVFIKAASHLLDNVPLAFMPVLMPTNTLATTPSKPNKDKAIYLKDVAKKWQLETKPVDRTVTQYQRHIAYFEEVIGNLPINEITKKHFIEYKDTKQARGDSPQNINRSIDILKILFNFAIREDHISINPADKVKVNVKNNPKEARLPFDIDSLNIIFNSPIYCSNFRPAGGKGQAAFWIPLIALFTGARLGEICQLMKQDIKHEKYFDSANKEHFAWVLDITNTDDRQRLKNDGSRRKVPIHSNLINLGFIEYVQSQNNGLIFPELIASKKYDEIGTLWGKWFNRYLRVNLKITNKKFVFHSFRHTFKEYCRNAGIATEVHHALTGHSMGNVGDNYGGIYYPTLPLVEAISKYSIPNLKIAGTLI